MGWLASIPLAPTFLIAYYQQLTCNTLRESRGIDKSAGDGNLDLKQAAPPADRYSCLIKLIDQA
jgi:hypothetical protein